MRYQVTKTWGPELGLSCCFRQWRAQSHCRFLHGYALGIRIVFEAETLDSRNWVYDFGNLKWLKEWLVDTFDHKTIVAIDDPALSVFEDLAKQELIQLCIIPAVGCEAFAEWILAQNADKIQEETQGRVKIYSVEVFEHQANSARALA
ncbi:MAG: 6-carboxytetrahydropterin synthase [Gammaproteobacteria bacterium]|nr:6-carboxytetrahydropterin synthase [Gammaproteobacteria bacterium]